ncbi:non-oxidative hydroxyarylic acid decarboxylases subunit D [Streptomyces sp. MMG1121]|uniref:non-oxidative hydroxyarylic acid decarboxylases subunit D n=1 Tax=Streptomyces sp. MMG1121 TaxID=1415544 RepID=UPI0006ADAD7E|nr:non-oxidative hydroxyarylic acid decarboxylases subunit D [Streptomyces sp. MMG1121]KOV56219.1 4-hydroxybenzoate decarboxylase [Streptomyces sp. MMG1121]
MAEPTSTVCPRCACTRLEHVHSSPVPGVWDVLQCARCLYMWRTSEPARRARREAYPEGFRLTEEDLASADEVPAVPPPRASA